MRVGPGLLVLLTALAGFGSSCTEGTSPQAKPASLERSHPAELSAPAEVSPLDRSAAVTADEIDRAPEDAFARSLVARDVTFRVNDEQNNPIVGAEVSVWKRMPVAPTAPLSRQWTDQDGRIEVSLPAGSPVVSAKVGTELSSGAWPAGLQQPNDKDVQLIVRPRATISGRVFGPTLAPVSGAKVTVLVSTALPEDYDHGTCPQMPAVVRTNSNGEFELALDAPCRLANVLAQAKEGRAMAVVRDIAPGEQRTVAIAFTGDVPVHGHVKQGSGGETGGTVLFSNVDMVRVETASVDGSGRFEASLPWPGEYEIVVAGNECASGERTRISVDTGGAEVELGCEPHELMGKIVDETGHAVRGLRLLVVPLDSLDTNLQWAPPPWLRVHEVQQRMFVRTDEGGFFHCKGVWPWCAYALVDLEDGRELGRTPYREVMWEVVVHR